MFGKRSAVTTTFECFRKWTKSWSIFLKKRSVFEFTQTVGVLECDCMGIGVLFMNARVLLCTVDKWNNQMLLDRGIIKFYVKHISLFFLIYKIL